MSLIAPDVEALSRLLSRWEWGEYISEMFVIVACAGEWIADLKATWLTLEQKSHLQRRSTILLIASLSLSLGCLIRTNELSGNVIGSLGDKAANADREARRAVFDSLHADSESSDALLQASQASARAGKAQSDVSATEREAKELDKDLDAVRWVVSARRIQDEDGLEQDLRQFKGIPIVFDSYVGDEEAYWLCAQLANIAHKAGVESKDECAMKLLSKDLPITDLHISAPTTEEALRLSMLLKKPGRVPGIFVGINQAPEITVTVGVKPSVPMWPKTTPRASKATHETTGKP